MAMIRSKGGVVLNKYLVARVFAFDDHASEARAACVAKGCPPGAREAPATAGFICRHIADGRDTM